MATLELRHASFTYPGAVPVHALTDASLRIEAGEFVAIEGPSGSGKSTLLNILAVLSAPSSGEYLVNGISTAELSDNAAAALRSTTFGLIFQSFHLLRGRTALDNVILGRAYQGVQPDDVRDEALSALEFVGLAHRASFNVDKLSGGEQQRVAIARALCTGAPVILADEPTGNLDSENSRIIMDVLERLHERGVTVIVVTHDPTVASRADRRLHVIDGTVTDSQAPECTELNTSDAGNAALPILPAGTAGEDHADEQSADLEPPEPEDSTPHDSSRATRRLTLRMLIHDVFTSLRVHRRRTVSLVSMVVAGVMLALTTLGLSSSAQHQVSAAFDVNLNRRVSAAVRAPEGLSNGDGYFTHLVDEITPDSLQRIESLGGVEDAMVIGEVGDADVQAINPQNDPKGLSRQSIKLIGISNLPAHNDLMRLDNPRVGTELAPDQVLVGINIARQLEIGPIDASPTVWIDGQPHEVAGIITDAGVRTELLNAVVVDLHHALTYGAVSQLGLEVRTLPGAAPGVAQVLAAAWLPYDADQVLTSAPPNTDDLRDSIEGNVRTVLLTLTVVAILAALASLSNASASDVRSRTAEIAVRRAMGATRSHVRILISSESMIIGALGGIIGVSGAFIAILAVTIAQQWQPVLNPWSVPVGIIAGTLAGLLGSLSAARRASAIEPALALR